MQITKEFLVSEITELERELMKANTFVIQAQATLSAYQMLLRRLDAPEPAQPTESGVQDAPNSNSHD
jgi:hypothetical protein